MHRPVHRSVRVRGQAMARLCRCAAHAACAGPLPLTQYLEQHKPARHYPSFQELLKTLHHTETSIYEGFALPPDMPEFGCVAVGAGGLQPCRLVPLGFGLRHICRQARCVPGLWRAVPPVPVPAGTG